MGHRFYGVWRDVAAGGGLTAPVRWVPDDQMIAAVLSTPKASKKMTELSDNDRAWLVAGLTLAGVTAQDIADRMGCSLRLVRAIRAEDLTQFAVVAQTQNRTLTDELRVERCDHGLTRRELADARAEATRLRKQLDELLDAVKSGDSVRYCSKGLHLMLPYNKYRNGGKDRCRECRRLWQAEYRKTAELRSSSMELQHLHGPLVASAS